MTLARAFLVLAVLGAIVPYAFFVPFLAEHGFGAFVPALFASGAAGGFTADLLLSSVVFWLWMFVDARERERPPPWGCVVLNLTIGLSCALPAYLWLREGEVVAGGSAGIRAPD